MALRTDYKNDVLNTAINTERQFEEVTNPNGTKSYRDVTDYSQVGDNFDADLVNTQNAEINAKAPIESPNFTGNPTAPTKAQSVEDDSLATTAFVKAALTNAIDPNLRTSGKAADAKTTGDKLNSIQESVPTVDTTLKTSGAAADAKVTGDSVRSILNALVSETTTEAQIASCYDAAGEFPIKRLVANIIPKQDFNGYDHPWVGGAGKNLFNYDAWKGVGFSRGTVVFENNGVTVTSTGADCYSDYVASTYPVAARIPVEGGKAYTMSWETDSTETGDTVFLFPDGTTTNIIRTGAASKKLTITTPSDTTFLTMRVGILASGKTFYFRDIQIEEGTEATSYEPYENICPISGYTGVTVTRTGKNLHDGSLVVFNGGGTVKNGITLTKNSDGTFKLSGTATAETRVILTTPVQFKSGITYTISIKGLSGISANTVRIILNGNSPGMGLYYRSDYPVSDWNLTFTALTDIGFQYFLLDVQNGKTINNTISVQIEVGNTATEYEPYNGATYPITFPTVVGTVYGGTLTVNGDGSGTLTVDKATFTPVFSSAASIDDKRWGNGTYLPNVLSELNGKQWTVSDAPYVRLFRTSSLPIIKEPSLTDNDHASVSFYGHASGVEVRIRTMKAYYTQEDELSIANSIQVVYPITPTTYTLSAVDVAELLQGVNNVWMDADGTLFFEYYANTALYGKKIVNAQKGMIAGVEESMTATKNYVIGDLMIVGDSLYKVTAAISSGASLVIGTNITQTTVAEQLIALANAK